MIEMSGNKGEARHVGFSPNHYSNNTDRERLTRVGEALLGVLGAYVERCTLDYEFGSVRLYLARSHSLSWGDLDEIVRPVVDTEFPDEDE